MNTRNEKFQGKIFQGYIVDKKDPAGLNRKAVYIENLLKSQYPGEKYIWCKEIINTYIRTRDPLKNNIPYMSYGHYQPILPGTKVLVAFVNNNLESGYIIGIDSTVNTPLNKDKEWVIYKTNEGSEFYINEENNILHINHAKGKSNILMTDKDIILQINQHEKGNEDFLKNKTMVTLDSDGIFFKVGKASYKFSEEGVIFQISDEKSPAYLDFSKNAFNLNVGKTFSINTSESIHINSKKTFVSGVEELHLNANDTRLTGTQKAQISGSTVVMWGWLDAHVKGMHVGLDAMMSIDTQSIIKNDFSLAIANDFSILKSSKSVVNTVSTGIIAEGSSVRLQDGIILSGLGIGAAVAGAVTGTTSGVTTSIKLILAGINTTMLINTPFVGAANQVLSATIAGSASQASGGTITFGTGMTELDDYNIVTNNNYMRKTQEKNSKKYILPDKLNL